jgi:hypothetical protein
MFIYPIYNHNWRNIITIYTYITRLESNEIFSPSNKIHWEVGRAKDLSASRYYCCRAMTYLSECCLSAESKNDRTTKKEGSIEMFCVSPYVRQRSAFDFPFLSKIKWIFEAFDILILICLCMI